MFIVVSVYQYVWCCVQYVSMFGVVFSMSVCLVLCLVCQYIWCCVQYVWCCVSMYNYFVLAIQGADLAIFSKISSSSAS